MNTADKIMDHHAYPKSLKKKSNEALRFIIRDASEVAVDQPENPNLGFYLDEVCYASMELKNREIQQDSPNYLDLYHDAERRCGEYCGQIKELKEEVSVHTDGLITAIQAFKVELEEKNKRILELEARTVEDLMAERLMSHDIGHDKVFAVQIKDRSELDIEDIDYTKFIIATPPEFPDLKGSSHKEKRPWSKHHKGKFHN